MVMRKRFPATCSDREAAVGLLGRLARLDSSNARFDDIALRISEGGHDDTIWVQVFAAHRLTTLAALTEPSDAMKQEGVAVSISETFDTTDGSTYRWVSENDAGNIWRAMLDAWEQPA